MGGRGAQTHATGYVYAPLPKPAATCARTPRWLISSQISLLDCGAVVDGPCQPPSPFFYLSPSLFVDSLSLSLSVCLSLLRSFRFVRCIFVWLWIRTDSVTTTPRRPSWSYTGNPEHYCYTVVHCQRCKMETRGGRDIINDRRSRPKPEPALILPSHPLALSPLFSLSFFRSPFSFSSFILSIFFLFFFFLFQEEG